MKVEDKTLFLKPILGKSASKASQKPAFSSNTLRITNNTVQEGFKRNITLAAKKYTFSFFMDKGQQDLNDKEYYWVELFNSTNMNSPVYTYTTKVASTGYYNFNYTAPTEGTYVWRFRRISLNGRSSTGIAYFDDFKASYTVQQSQQVCSSPKNYRFGFNTQEKDDEVYGAGNLNTAMFWEYDTRLGRRWNTDPVVKLWESPYSTFANNPIFYSDLKGDDWVEGTDGGITWNEDVTADNYQNKGVLKKGEIYRGTDFSRYRDWRGVKDGKGNVVNSVVLEHYKSDKKMEYTALKGNMTASIQFIRSFANQNLPYNQLGNRTGIGGDAWADGLDCSELVNNFLYVYGSFDEIGHNLYTGVMTTENSFRSTIGTDKVSLSTTDVPQAGDIFVWRNNGEGHTGVVLSYDSENDLVWIAEAIGASGSSDNSTNRKYGGTTEAGITRTAVFSRKGKALAGHGGWVGYFRPTAQ